MRAWNEDPGKKFKERLSKAPLPTDTAVADTLAREAQYENTGSQRCSKAKLVTFIDLSLDEAPKAKDEGEDKDKEAEEKNRGAEGETARTEVESNDEAKQSSAGEADFDATSPTTSSSEKTGAKKCRSRGNSLHWRWRGVG
jgi:hypothetical protein